MKVNMFLLSPIQRVSFMFCEYITSYIITVKAIDFRFVIIIRVCIL